MLAEEVGGTAAGPGGGAPGGRGSNQLPGRFRPGVR